jgi:NADPH:quinone reductase-like Zn-dependent oxidoreductase
MQAAVASGYGGVECIAVCPGEAVPVPGENEVLIRVAFASINPVDWKMLSGYLALFESGGPTKRRVRGFDACGEIVQTGQRCTRLKAGDKVVCMLHFSQVTQGRGTFAQFVAVDERRVKEALFCQVFVPSLYTLSP